ncbi:hypothetical protein EVAR_62767_1 [Eumeta japonica]|uniref:Uncharacterized protein n=1 Tax=Eumeta variegata TaxID=151549 RepID=A0A4C1ZKW9_EUMVA|nr:hypothetical protein EVAR_62767_1 [Eumeta japonica]
MQGAVEPPPSADAALSISNRNAYLSNSRRLNRTLNGDGYSSGRVARAVGDICWAFGGNLVLLSISSHSSVTEHLGIHLGIGDKGGRGESGGRGAKKGNDFIKRGSPAVRHGRVAELRLYRV